MVSRFVDGINGNDGNDGLSPITGGGHGPKASLNGVEDTPVVAGDTIYVRPTVYRELWTWDVSGGNAYTAGTVNVTNGSAVVIGVGTLWLANVAADYMFHNTIFASGADGVTNGTATFTSAAGNFQAAMVGQIIQINTRGAYKIDAVGGLNTITLSDPNGLGWPGAAVGLTYSVMSGMGPFDILSVGGNTQLTLTAPWYGPTLTGLAYITYNPIRAIGDVTGEIWGVGGTVRITGSDNDQTATRANGISAGAQSYRVLRGFTFDLSTSHLISGVGGSYNTVEDCSFSHMANGSQGVNVSGAGQLGITVRRCSFLVSRGNGISFTHTVVVNNAGHLISNCRSIGIGYSVVSTRIGGISVKNSVVIAPTNAFISIFIAPTVGQTISVTNSVIQGIGVGFSAIAVGQITPNYCALFGLTTSYVNTAAGANDLAYPALFAMPTFFSGQAGVSGLRLPPPMLGELSPWSQVRAIAGFGEAPADIFGLKRPATSAKNSWGAVQYQNLTYDTTTVRTAGGKSLELSDAGRAQVILASTNRPLKVRVYVYREANYAGTNPQLIVKQAGQADVVITDAGAAGVWNVLEANLTPSVYPGFIVIEYVSNNTALAGAYAVYFDDSMISSFYNPGKMDNWVSDVQPANTPVTSFSRAALVNGEGR